LPENQEKEIYILSKNEISNPKNNKNTNKYRYTEIIGGLFREREDFFDASFIPVYKKNPKFYDMTRNKMLHEVISNKTSGICYFSHNRRYQNDREYLYK